MKQEDRQREIQIVKLAYGGYGLARRPTPKAYADAIRKTPISGKLRAALDYHASRPNSTASEVQLSDEVNWRHDGLNAAGFRGQYGRFSHSVAKHLGLESNLKHAAWTFAIGAGGRAAKSRFAWRLYPEFVKGLHLAGILDEVPPTDMDENEPDSDDLAGTGFGDPESRRDVEEAAIRFAIKYYRQRIMDLHLKRNR